MNVLYKYQYVHVVVDLDGALFPNLDGDRTETNLAKRIPNSDQKPPKAKRTAHHQRDVHLSAAVPPRGVFELCLR